VAVYPPEAKNVNWEGYVVVSFTNENIIPTTGSIEIKFPTGFTLHSGCRSAVNMGSKLVSSEGGTGANIGAVGCVVQNTQSWVITNFKE
jgi:hypothetical protein